MVPSLTIMFQATLLFVNAFAVLHEQRFLNKVGLSEEAVALDNGVKRQVVNLLKAVRLVTRIPLIVVNSIVIVALMLLG
ncbi:hypothetical protein BU14_0209s0025 [Porphyra umbilicalis]|uniref:Immediate early response 3-interacting protein 1 n=1 Tax=Porphyra umbilicalis TaxID=2786 RepID=A0A1X6P5W5_PORUM|nr:hypothetical protein BU14_0209s0025 [Porphyra umbilicalis]|eukprot:OSX76033.1 hypothetical protein BU14_0209s0025 [Porphyra umbilicalis]